MRGLVQRLWAWSWTVGVCLLAIPSLTRAQACDPATTAQIQAHVAAVRSQTDRARLIHAGTGSHNINTRARLKSIDSLTALLCATPVVVPPPVPVNQPPVAVIGASCVVGPTGPTGDYRCTFSGAGSTDDKGIATYAWAVTGQAAKAGVQAIYGLRAGTYSVTLTVADSAGLTGTNQLQQIVGGGVQPPDSTTPPPVVNTPPIARFTSNCTALGADFDCLFNAATSSDADGSIVTYAWTVPTCVSAQTWPGVSGHCTLAAGTYTVTLSVTDDRGASAGVTQALTVGTPAPPPPPPPPPTGTSPSTDPQPPRVQVSVALPPETRVVNVPLGANLQTYLDNAQRGDALVLPAGGTFTQDVVLKPKAGSCSSYVTVRTSAMPWLPPLGTRIDPAVHAQYMPKIVAQTVSTPVQTALGACGWRFIGIEITVAANIAVRPDPNRQQGLVYLGNPYTADTTQQGSDMVLDRVYVHGLPNTNMSRCVLLSGKRLAVVNSQLLECHGLAFDSQAIASYRGTGPYLVQNNRLEAAGEIMLFGGDVAPNGVVASDVTIRGNIMTRPMSWQGVWTVKNLFELKNAQRVLVEANIFENHWCCGQQGPSIMLGTLDNPCTWCIVADVDFQWNHINNVSGVFNLVDRYTNPAGDPQRMVRVRIMNNLATNVLPLGGQQPRCYIIQKEIHDLHIERNTCGAGYAYVIVDAPPKTRFTFRANAQTMAAQYPWFSSWGQGDASFTATLAQPYKIDNNLFIASAPTLVPNSMTCTTATPVCGNIRLTSPGPIPAGVGVDQAALQARLAGVR